MTEASVHLSFRDFDCRLQTAHASLDNRVPQLEELGKVPVVTVHSYGSKGRELTRLLRGRGVKCIIFDNSQASRDQAHRDGFRVTPDLDATFPIVVAAGQNQIEILEDLNRPAFNLLEALWAFDVTAGYGPAREFNDLTRTTADALFEVYRRLDAESAATFLDVLQCRAGLDVRHLKSRRHVSQMWRPPIHGLELHSFCDIGAYDGDSLRSITSAIRTIKKSFTIEPNGDLARSISDAARECNVDNRHFVGAAWKSRTRLDARTLPNGMFVIEETPDGNIHADTLDELLQGTAYDYIKMDVEGTEREVIDGGKNSIASAKCIAVAGYHLPADLIDLPTQLEGILGGAFGSGDPEGWKLAFAHYSQVFDDSIFYAWRPTDPSFNP